MSMRTTMKIRIIYSIICQVTELLITHGANVNAMDLWQFTPLHEAASKSRTEVRLLCSNYFRFSPLINFASPSAHYISHNLEVIFVFPLLVLLFTWDCWGQCITLDTALGSAPRGPNVYSFSCPSSSLHF